MTDTIKYPTVYISNAIDTLQNIANRASTLEIEKNINESLFQQDQAIFWRPVKKLLITSQPIDHISWLCNFLEFNDIINVSPKSISDNLIHDILRDSELLRLIAQYINKSEHVNIIPHTTTINLFELQNVLESTYGIQINLPESTKNQDFRNQLDTKSGFRNFVEEYSLCYGNTKIPSGKICNTAEETTQVVLDFLKNGTPCIVKPDKGEGGIGLSIFQINSDKSFVHDALIENAYLSTDKIVVEEYISGQNIVFPSVEYDVSRDKNITPYLTHACLMLFDAPTVLRGNVTSPELKKENWYNNFISTSEAIAAQLQKLDYVGHFGIDAVAQNNGDLYLLEMNPRRTGSSHLHDFGVHFFTKDYMKTIGNYDFYSHKKPIPLTMILRFFNPYIKSPVNSKEGIVPIELTGLKTGRLSILIYTDSLDRFWELLEYAKDAFNKILYELKTDYITAKEDTK